jgi:hypothetical protein
MIASKNCRILIKFRGEGGITVLFQKSKKCHGLENAMPDFQTAMNSRLPDCHEFQNMTLGASQEAFQDLSSLPEAAGCCCKYWSKSILQNTIGT